MLAGVATRRHCLVSDPIGEELEIVARGDSRAAVSRWFISATAARLAELLGEDLSGLEVAVLMIDGIVFAKCCCVVALVVTTDGTKVPVGLWDGDTENATVVKDLLADLVARDLSYEGGGSSVCSTARRHSRRASEYGSVITASAAFTSTPAISTVASPKSNWAWTARVREGDEDLLGVVLGPGDGRSHLGGAPRVAVFVAQPLIDALGRVALFGGAVWSASRISSTTGRNLPSLGFRRGTLWHSPAARGGRGSSPALRR